MDYLFTDVTDENSIIKNLDIVKNKLGDINLVVNCAGIGTPEKILEKKEFTLLLHLRKY